MRTIILIVAGVVLGGALFYKGYVNKQDVDGAGRRVERSVKAAGAAWGVQEKGEKK